jgi:hypothetical protein
MLADLLRFGSDFFAAAAVFRAALGAAFLGERVFTGRVDLAIVGSP